jgi:DNA-directed RNA polymerase III subunit RPC6
MDSTRAGPSASAPGSQIDQIEGHQMRLQELILHIARSKPDGINDDEVKAGLPGHVTDMQRLEAYNKLLKKGRLNLLHVDGVLHIQEVSKEVAAKFRGLGADDRMVYDLIEKSGNMGIWARELRQKSGLVQNQFNKVLKTLETRRMIKSVKSVKAKNKKFYMVAELEPSKELTGGPWYSEQKEYDVDFIIGLQTHIEHYLRKTNLAVSVQNVVDYVQSSGISKEPLDIANMAQLLETMVYDGTVERVEHEERIFLNGQCRNARTDVSAMKYRIRPPPLELSVKRIMESPCSTCPIRSDCQMSGPISPAACKYLDEWFDSP